MIQASDTCQVLQEYSGKVAPQRIEVAELAALEVCGWTAEEWAGAPSLREVLDQARPLFQEGAIPAGHNVTFDLAFLGEAWQQCGIASPALGYHRLDTVALAWPFYALRCTYSLNLDTVCQHLGIPRPHPHHALTDARASLEVARKTLAIASVVADFGLDKFLKVDALCFPKVER